MKYKELIKNINWMEVYKETLLLAVLFCLGSVFNTMWMVLFYLPIVFAVDHLYDKYMKA